MMTLMSIWVRTGLLTVGLAACADVELYDPNACPSEDVARERCLELTNEGGPWTAQSFAECIRAARQCTGHISVLTSCPAGYLCAERCTEQAD